MQALTVEQTMERFKMGRETVLEVFRKEDSPAYKVGPYSKSPWRVDEEDFKEYLKAKSKQFKG
jgi:hypothetical protein